MCSSCFEINQSLFPGSATACDVNKSQKHKVASKPRMTERSLPPSQLQANSCGSENLTTQSGHDEGFLTQNATHMARLSRRTRLARPRSCFLLPSRSQLPPSLPTHLSASVSETTGFCLPCHILVGDLLLVRRVVVVLTSLPAFVHFLEHLRPATPAVCRPWRRVSGSHLKNPKMCFCVTHHTTPQYFLPNTSTNTAQNHTSHQPHHAGATDTLPFLSRQSVLQRHSLT